MTRCLRTFFVLAALVLCSVSSALANSACLGAGTCQLLTFAGLPNMQSPNNAYSGISFSSNFLVLVTGTRGGSGAFAPTPIGTPLIFVNGLTTTNATGIMNVASGVTTGIQFFFTAGFSESVTAWSGANGTGTILATLALSPNNLACPVYQSYCNWSTASLGFTGTANSFTFSGPADGLGIADITLGQTTTAIPEPSSFYFLGTGLAAFGFGRIRRFWN